MPSRGPDEEFVERHWRLALWVARRRARQAGWRGDPDEVESDALLGLWHAARTFKPGDTPASWVRVHVERAITDGLRRRHGERRFPATQSVKRPDHLADLNEQQLAQITAPDHAPRVVDHVDLARALATLTPRERHVLTRWVEDGTPLHTIGSDLGVTESRASQIATSARRKLRRALKVQNDDVGPHYRSQAVVGAVLCVSGLCGLELTRAAPSQAGRAGTRVDTSRKCGP